MNIDIITKEEFSKEIESLKEKLDLILENHKPPKQWLRTSDVCNLLGISKSTLQNYRNSDRIPFRKLNGTILYPREAIDMLLETNGRDKV